MLALLAALSLTAGSLEQPPSFEPTLFDLSEVQGSGGDTDAGRIGRNVAFLGLGTLATGGLLVVGLPFVSGLSDGAGLSPGPLLFLVPMLASVALNVGLGALLDVDVTWPSAFVGAGFGVVTSVALGFGFLMLVPDQEILSVLMFFAGAVIGYAIGTPLFTLLDPLGLATPKSAAAPAKRPNAPDVTIEVVEPRPLETAAVERVGMSVALWNGQF